MTDQVRKIEENIAEAKQFLEMNAALERLSRNPDFKAVLTDGYLKTEAVRLVHLKSDPHMQTPDRQAGVVRDIDAIGGLVSYFRTVAHNAQVALKAIEAGEDELNELRQEI
jgi:hypothetical protein